MHVFPTLKQRYREAAERGEWAKCLELADAMHGLGLRDADAADAEYAVGLAHEMLGHRAQARSHYESVLMMQRHHSKALKRVRLLS